MLRAPNFAFFNFAAKYFGPKADPTLPKGWEPDEKLINDFQRIRAVEEPEVHRSRVH